MKTTRIDVEGPNGTATVRRDGRRVLITGTRATRVVERRDGRGVLLQEPFELHCDARDAATAEEVARALHTALEGRRGTAGDVADYQRVIQAFGD